MVFREEVEEVSTGVCFWKISVIKVGEKYDAEGGIEKDGGVWVGDVKRRA